MSEDTAQHKHTWKVPNCFDIDGTYTPSTSTATFSGGQLYYLHISLCHWKRRAAPVSDPVAAAGDDDEGKRQERVDARGGVGVIVMMNWGMTTCCTLFTGVEIGQTSGSGMTWLAGIIAGRGQDNSRRGDN